MLGATPALTLPSQVCPDTHPFEGGAVLSSQGARTGRNVRIGRLVPALIVEFLRAGNWSPTGLEIRIAAGKAASPSIGQVSRYCADRQRVAAGVLELFRYHVPPQDWVLVGERVVVHDVEMDLLWRRPDGRLVADEIKSGRLLKPLFTRALREQIEAQLAAGHAEFADAFAGVRLLWLANHQHSFFAPAKAVQVPLEEATT